MTIQTLTEGAARHVVASVRRQRIRGTIARECRRDMTAIMAAPPGTTTDGERTDTPSTLTARMVRYSLPGTREDRAVASAQTIPLRDKHGMLVVANYARLAHDRERKEYFARTTANPRATATRHVVPVDGPLADPAARYLPICPIVTYRDAVHHGTINAGSVEWSRVDLPTAQCSGSADGTRHRYVPRLHTERTPCQQCKAVKDAARLAARNAHDSPHAIRVRVVAAVGRSRDARHNNGGPRMACGRCGSPECQPCIRAARPARVRKVLNASRERVHYYVRAARAWQTLQERAAVDPTSERVELTDTRVLTARRTFVRATWIELRDRDKRARERAARDVVERDARERARYGFLTAEQGWGD